MFRRRFRLQPCLLLLAACAALAPAARAADFFWSTGDFVTGATAPEPLLSGDTLFITSGGTKRFVGSSFTNQGLVRWQADVLQGGNGTVVTNSGVWQSESDANTLSWAFGGRPTFVNTGSFAKTAGAVTNVGNWAFVNNGGLIDAQVGQIVFNGDANTFNAGTRFGGAGQVLHTGASTFNGSFQSDNFGHAGGSMHGNAAVLNGGVASAAGSMGWSGGDLTGSWTVAAGSTLGGSDGGTKRLVGTSVVNQGLIRWDSTQTLQTGNGSSITNQGLLQASQSGTFEWIFGGRPSLINEASGLVQATGSATLTIGNLALTSNGGIFTADPGGAIRYTGDASRFNDGTRFVGDHRMLNQQRFVGVIESDNLRWISGAQYGGDGSPGSSARMAGQVSWEGGDLRENFEIMAGATVTGRVDGATRRQVGGSLVNNGTLRWDTTDLLQGGNGSAMTNNALIEVRQTATFEWIFGGRPSLVNEASGTIRATNGAVLTLGNYALTSHGGLFEADAGSAIRYTGDASRFNDGTRFVGEHRMLNQQRYVGTIESNNLRWIAGTQYGGDGVTPGSAGRLAGQVSWEGGDLRENFEILSGATVTALNDGGAKRQVGSNVINSGTLRWDNTAVLQGGNGSSLTNQALIEARQTASFEWIFGGRPTLTNEASGTIRATHNAVLTLGSYALTSNGGRFVADAGSAIRYTGDASRFNDGTRFVGDHQMLGQARYVGTIQSDNLHWIAGTQYGGDGSPGSSGRFAGQVFWEGGDLRENFEIMAGATMTGTGASAKRQVGGSITNNGTFNWATGATLQGGNGSQFTNNGRFDMMADAAVAWIFGGQPHFANNGLVIKTAGAGAGDLSSLALSNNGTIDVRSGSISLPNNFVNAGTLKGTGAFNVAGTLFNNGHMAPGASPGTLTLNGSYNQGAAGVFDVELEGVASHDLLLVNGNAALNGALALSCFGNCSLAVGDEVVILDATGSLTGEFVPGLALSGFGSGAFDVVYDRVGARVLLQVTEAVTPAVPEPGTYALMAAGLAAVGLLARRRHVLPR